MLTSIVNRLKKGKTAKVDKPPTGILDGDSEVDHALDTARLRFLLTCSEGLVPDRPKVKEALLENIKEKNMVAFYIDTCEHGLLTRDESLLSSMKAANAGTLAELEEKEKNMKENHGEIEVMDVLLEISRFFALSGSISDALEAYDKAFALKSCSTGQKIDVILKKLLLGLVWHDNQLVSKSVEESEELMESGGDWDRRNRLKSYRGIHALISRDFEKASEDFLSAIATFTTTELCSYAEFIFYAIMTGIVVLDRVTFKKKIIDSPEVLSVVHEIPNLKEFMNNLYDCNYKGFFESLVKLNQQISTDRYLASHRDWFYREVRILAYVQFLESYKSVTLDSMSSAFGVSKSFLDKELSHFISSGRVSAKIDKVAGVIETSRPNNSNAKYQSIIKHGDVLLNRVQLLSRSINV